MSWRWFDDKDFDAEMLYAGCYGPNYFCQGVRAYSVVARKWIHFPDLVAGR